MHHPESCCLFEVMDEEEYRHLFDGPDGGLLADVTGIEWAEKEFAATTKPQE